MMKQKACAVCGKTCWHNSMANKPGEEPGWRCTYCGYPLGTGPKRERNEPIHEKQLSKARK